MTSKHKAGIKSDRLSNMEVITLTFPHTTTVALLLSVVLFGALVINGDSTTCETLYYKAQLCSQESVKVSKCDGHTKSRSLACLELTLQEAKMCEETKVETSIKHFFDMFRLSQRLICANDFYKDIGSSDTCWSIATAMTAKISNPFMPFYSTNGCKMEKFLLFADKSWDRCPALKPYASKLFDRSQCGYITTSIEGILSLPDQKKECLGTYASVENCVHQYAMQLPNCGSENELLKACLQNARQNLCTAFSYEDAIRRSLWRYEKTVDLFCNNEEFKKDLSNVDCWKHVMLYAIITKGMIEGFLTSAGCKLVKVLSAYDNEGSNMPCWEMGVKVNEELLEFTCGGKANCAICIYPLPMVLLLYCALLFFC